MYNNFLIYTFFYFFILLSIVGFGFLFSNLLFKKNNQNNFGYLGLIGILFLIIYSYISNFFIPHSKIHNLSLILVGFFIFCYYFYRNIKIYFKDIPLIFFVFLLLLFSSLLFKTHDDFEYYHFPYSYYLTQYDFIFGTGHLNHGFRTPSSIFYLNSLFFLPKINYYFFHISPVYIMGFVNLILLKKIFYFEKKYNFDFIKVYSLLSFLFINIFFYRIAEHGTDRTAQILVFVLILELFLIINYPKLQKEVIKNFFILLSIIISLKAFYIIYILFLVPVFFLFLKKKPIDFFKIVLKNSCFSILAITCLLVFFSNFVNTGCIIYPISITCLTSFDWSLPLDEVNRMRQWYELWAKAGAGPNFRVENINEYLSYINWIPNWINKYFFNKVSDFLLGIVFVSVVFYITFYSKVTISNKKNYNITGIYIVVIILWLEWLFNHPALRYGGYHLFSLMIFIPLAYYLTKFENKNNILRKKIYFFVCLTLLIFVSRNTSRLFNEINVYDYKPFSKVYFSLSDNGFRIQKKINKTIENYKMCSKNKDNCDSNLIPKVKLFSGKYIFTVKND